MTEDGDESTEEVAGPGVETADMSGPGQEPLFDPSAMLCHYTGAHTAFEYILPSGKLRMNAYAQMRDPFENHQHHLRVAGGMTTDADNSLWLDIVNTAGWLRSRKRLLSLTQGDEREGTLQELPFRCPWARARLWEQYADNHRGVCLVFDRQAMLQAVRDGLRGSEVWDGPVHYTVAGFSASNGATLRMASFEQESLQKDVERHLAEHRRDFFFLKTEEWASEFEYRIVLGDDPGPGVVFAPSHDVSYGESLRYVLVNRTRFPYRHLPGASQEAKRRKAELLPIIWAFGRPAVGRWGTPHGS